MEAIGDVFVAGVFKQHAASDGHMAIEEVRRAISGRLAEMRNTAMRLEVDGLPDWEKFTGDVERHDRKPKAMGKR